MPICIRGPLLESSGTTPVAHLLYQRCVQPVRRGGVREHGTLLNLVPTSHPRGVGGSRGHSHIGETGHLPQREPAPQRVFVFPHNHLAVGQGAAILRGRTLALPRSKACWRWPLEEQARPASRNSSPVVRLRSGSDRIRTSAAVHIRDTGTQFPKEAPTGRRHVAQKKPRSPRLLPLLLLLLQGRTPNCAPPTPSRWKSTFPFRRETPPTAANGRHGCRRVRRTRGKIRRAETSLPCRGWPRSWTAGPDFAPSSKLRSSPRATKRARFAARRDGQLPLREVARSRS
mmetsp:Transcript_26524/g.66878  ORF Transcript_26524/g.66878 Transcript_26524/m.66878 type:complete len:286 (-) Transcript_26524:970-1827(-)